MPLREAIAEGATRVAMRDAKLVSAIQQDPTETVPALVRDVVTALPDVVTKDVWIYRGIVFGLLAVLILCVGLMGWMSSAHAEVPQAIVAIASGALGALAGLLAPSPSQH